MATVIIEEITKTEKAGLFTICFEGDAATEFEKFMNKFKEDAERKDDLSIILTAISKMLMAVSLSGFSGSFFLLVLKVPGKVCQYIHNRDDCGHNAKTENEEGWHET